MTRIEVFKKHEAKDAQDAYSHLQEKIDELNRTRKGVCWICHSPESRNWGILFPDNGSDSLGFGSSKNEDGDEYVRMAFFCFCPEHDLEDPENMQKVNQTLVNIKREISN